MALLMDGVIYVANVGDSRAVLSANGRAVPLSADHKPDRKDERQRIENLGGRVVFWGTWRVEGVLAVTRAFGDRQLKPLVSSAPDIVRHTISEYDQFLILASDGLWDVLSNERAVEIVSSIYPDTKTASFVLVQTAFEMGSSDNITALVVDLDYYNGVA